MEGLILHCGAEKMTREQLREIPTPQPTRTWRPVSHFEAATLIAFAAEKRGYGVVGEEYGVTPAGTKMFGVLRFSQQGPVGMTRALGIRNSNDKSLALSIVAGERITVCDNLLLSGSITIHRKHTSGIIVEELVSGAFDKLAEEFARLEANIGRLKSELLTEDDARIAVVRAAEMRAIPSSDILPVLHEFREPQHEEFRERTRWSLYNSFTENVKKYSPARADLCYRRLGRMFGLE